MEKNLYVIPKGRLAKVSCIQNYAKEKRYTKANSRQKQGDQKDLLYTSASKELRIISTLPKEGGKRKGSSVCPL